MCSHEQRSEIDALLVADTPLRKIAERFGTSTTALHRHKNEHLPVHLTKAVEAAEVVQADNLLGQVRNLQGRALSILDKAEEAGDLRTALGAIREARSNLELLAKLLGELQQEGTVNVYLSPEWLQLRSAILEALAPHPDAAKAIERALTA